MLICKVQKLNIAVEFIDDAIKLYDEKRYFSALHLAGAAEEIFATYAVELNLVPAKVREAKFAKQLCRTLYKTDESLKELEKFLDIPKNSIKHAKRHKNFDPEAILTPPLDAFRMIRRALKNAYLINAPVSPLIYSFLSKNAPLEQA